MYKDRTHFERLSFFMMILCRSLTSITQIRPRVALGNCKNTSLSFNCSVTCVYWEHSFQTPDPWISWSIDWFVRQVSENQCRHYIVVCLFSNKIGLSIFRDIQCRRLWSSLHNVIPHPIRDEISDQSDIYIRCYEALGAHLHPNSSAIEELSGSYIVSRHITR